MKLTSDKKDKDQISIVKQKQQIKELVIDKVLKPNHNHIVFEINPDTKEIKVAEYINSKTIHFHDALKFINEKDVIKKDNCYYLSALNYENLIRKNNLIGYSFIRSKHESGKIKVNVKTYKK